MLQRATNETATEMREHPDFIRYGLMGTFLYVCGTEVTDDITRMTVELIQRLDKRSEKQIFRELLADVARVEGKMQILSRVAEAVASELKLSPLQPAMSWDDPPNIWIAGLTCSNNLNAEDSSLALGTVLSRRLRPARGFAAPRVSAALG